MEEKELKEAKSGQAQAEAKSAKLEETLQKEIAAEKQSEKVIEAATLAKQNAQKALDKALVDKTTLEKKIQEDLKSANEAKSAKAQLEKAKKDNEEKSLAKNKE